MTEEAIKLLKEVNTNAVYLYAPSEAVVSRELIKRIDQFLRSNDKTLNQTPKDNWRDISEAPKDGTRILAYAHGSHNILRWFESSQTGGKARWKKFKEDNKRYKPTHFMLLPTPPSPDNGSEVV